MKSNFRDKFNRPFEREICVRMTWVFRGISSRMYFAAAQFTIERWYKVFDTRSPEDLIFVAVHRSGGESLHLTRIVWFFDIFDIQTAAIRVWGFFEHWNPANTEFYEIRGIFLSLVLNVRGIEIKRYRDIEDFEQQFRISFRVAIYGSDDSLFSNTSTIFKTFTALRILPKTREVLRTCCSLV